MHLAVLLCIITLSSVTAKRGHYVDEFRANHIAINEDFHHVTPQSQPEKIHSTRKWKLIEPKAELHGKEEFLQCLMKEMSLFCKNAKVILTNARTEILVATKNEQKRLKPLMHEVFVSLNETAVGIKERVQETFDDFRRRDYFGAIIDLQELYTNTVEGFGHLHELRVKIKHVDGDIKTKLHPIIKETVHKLKEELHISFPKMVKCKKDLLLEVRV